MGKKSDYPKLRRGAKPRPAERVLSFLLEILVPIISVVGAACLGFVFGSAECDCVESSPQESLPQVRIVRSATDRELAQCKAERAAVLKKLNYLGVSYYKGRFYTDTLWPSRADR